MTIREYLWEGDEENSFFLLNVFTIQIPAFLQLHLKMEEDKQNLYQLFVNMQNPRNLSYERYERGAV